MKRETKNGQKEHTDGINRKGRRKIRRKLKKWPRK
jgi:hypothetical protein